MGDKGILKSAKLSDDWADIEEIITYGYGNTAKIFLAKLSHYIKIHRVIDNDAEKWGMTPEGVPICSYEEAEDDIHLYKIVIMAETIAYERIKDSLEDKGLNENEDFVGLERFICEWFYLYKNKVYLMEVHAAITTSCSLRCKHCNMFIPYFGDKKDIAKINELTDNIDLLMKHIDFLFKFQIVGGEPLLNRNLGGYLDYIGKHYRKRIGWIRVITNGTVMPTDSLCATMKEKDVELCISDYTRTGKNIIKNITDKLNAFGVKYSLNSSLVWRDFGFPKNIKRRPPHTVRDHMLNCGTSWHGLQDGRIYYCNSGYAADRAGMFKLKRDDYVDLKVEEDLNISSRIIDKCLGEDDTWYHSFCSVCGGCGTDNSIFVPVGDQLD